MKRGWLFLLLILAAAASTATAATLDKERIRKTFVSGILHEFATNTELKSYNYSRTELEELFSGINADMKPRNRTYPRPTVEKRIDTYRRLFLNNAAIHRGRVYLRVHGDELHAAGKHYGVPAEVIVAILWLESGFAHNLGDKNTLTALYTTYADSVLDGKAVRAREFTRQTAYFLALCKREKWDCRGVTGSSAGAMGIPQFMPVAWWHYAVDGDDDGKINLFTSHPDAIWSAANYLSVHGFARDPRGTILKYNNDKAYAETILAYAKELKKQSLA